MNVQRSSLDAKAGRTNSYPDLSNIQTDLPISAIRNIKRKQPDDSHELANFRKEIMDFLTNFSAAQNTSIKKISEDVSVIMEQLNVIKITTDSLSQEQSALKESVKHLENKQDINNAHFQQQIDTLNSNFASLSDEFQAHQQRERLCNIEIHGLPESKNENLVETILKIAKYADVNLQPSDIIIVNRVQPRQPTPGRPKVIVCKLKLQIFKDSIIAGIRKQKGINTTHLGIPGDKRAIFVNEHLTVHNKILFKQVKELVAKTITNTYGFEIAVFTPEKAILPLQ